MAKSHEIQFETQQNESRRLFNDLIATCAVLIWLLKTQFQHLCHFHGANQQHLEFITCRYFPRNAH